MDQRHQFVVARTGRRHAGPEAHARDQVKVTFLALGRGQEHFLVQPGDVTEVETRRPQGAEAQEELREDLLEQHLQALVVVRSRLCHDGLPELKGADGSPRRVPLETPILSIATRSKGKPFRWLLPPSSHTWTR